MSHWVSEDILNGLVVGGITLIVILIIKFVLQLLLEEENKYKFDIEYSKCREPGCGEHSVGFSDYCLKHRS